MGFTCFRSLIGEHAYFSESLPASSTIGFSSVDLKFNLSRQMNQNLLRLSACVHANTSTVKLRAWGFLSIRHSSSTRHEGGDPLRILFCGSDAFSAVSLNALHEYSKQPESNILSIDVVTKPDKRTGRGLKILKPPPIKSFALNLGLPLHQIDTFTGWDPPQNHRTAHPSINLIIAVSFGRLIPPRLLNSSKYGGLNIHPSMLPDLPGAAPIQWTIMHGRTTTGVTIQALHPFSFDQGVILDQSPSPGLTIPNPDRITTKELTSLLAPVGAEILVSAVRNRLYIPPFKPVQLRGSDSTMITYAPKITTAMCAIDFDALTSTEILRRNRAIGPLYALAKHGADSDRVSRIKFGTDMRAPIAGDIAKDIGHQVESIPNGVPYAIVGADDNIEHSSKALIVNTLATKDGNCQIVIPTITVSSMKSGLGASSAARAGLFGEPKLVGAHHLYRFLFPLTASTQPEPVRQRAA